MKSIIIYYSLEGNTRFIAKKIAETINADLLEIEPINDIPKTGFSRYLKGGKQVVRKEKPELKHYELNLDDYETIFFGTPVWAGSFAAAFNTFFSQEKIENKKVALFACHRGGKVNVFANFRKKLSNNKILGQKDFKEPLKNNPKDNAILTKEWAKEITT